MVFPQETISNLFAIEHVLKETLLVSRTTYFQRGKKSTTKQPQKQKPKSFKMRQKKGEKKTL
jgi:hypothetical protein